MAGIAGYASGMAPPPASWAPAAWGGTAAYGTRPTVPSPTVTAGTAIGGNIGNLGALYGLGGGINQFQAQQAGAQVATNLPGYKDLVAKSSGNIQDLLAGQIPEDVVSQIIQGAAERGIMTGSPGSPNANAALLRSLGLTSLGLQEKGETELTAAIGRTPTGGMFQPASMLVSPEQQQAAEAAGRLYASAPDPSAAAAASLRTASAGLGAGLGSVSPVLPGAQSFNYGAPAGGGYRDDQVYPSLATGMSYGGNIVEPGAEPTSNFGWYGSPTSTGTGSMNSPIYDPELAPMIGAEGTGTWDQYLSDQMAAGLLGE